MPPAAPPPPPAPNKDGAMGANGEPLGMVMELQQKRETDLLAYCVATLCAIDVVLCMRILHVRTVFGLVFSVCGLFGCATRKRSYVLMYVIHTSFTFVRGVMHTGTIILGHPNVLAALGLASTAAEVAEESHHASIVAVFLLVLLEVAELLIAVLVYVFYSSIKDQEPSIIDDVGGAAQYMPADPQLIPLGDAAGGGAHPGAAAEQLAPPPKAAPQPQPPSSAVSGLLRRRKKKK